MWTAGNAKRLLTYLSITLCIEKNTEFLNKANLLPLDSLRKTPEAQNKVNINIIQDWKGQKKQITQVQQRVLVELRRDPNLKRQNHAV